MLKLLAALASGVGRKTGLRGVGRFLVVVAPRFSGRLGLSEERRRWFAVRAPNVLRTSAVTFVSPRSAVGGRGTWAGGFPAHVKLF